MFSCIVPTMWRYAPFTKFLEDLVECPLVDDIIIINNDITRTPFRLDVFDNPKIRTIVQDKNIFCNPAWNLGVSLAKNNKICIMNDDIVFDLRVFRRARGVSETFPVWGMIAGDPIFKQPPVTDGNIDIRIWNKLDSTFGFGQLMFIYKPFWLPIPDDLKLYYGDDWIKETTVARKKEIMLISNMMFKTPCAVTSSEMKGDLLDREFPIYNQAIVKFYQSHKREIMEDNFLQHEYERAYKEPSDINEHLPTLLKLANECETVVEFGVRTGVSTRAFLHSRAAVWSIDIEPLDEAIQLFLNAQTTGKVCNITKEDSLETVLVPTDLLFIDTHHTYEQLSAELERHHEKIAKYIVLHDTESYPNLMRAVFHFLSLHGTEWTLSNHYPNNNGLTILQRT